MTRPGTEVDRRWAAVLRWHPYGLLATGAVLSVAAAELTPTAGERGAVLALVVGALALQLWWGRAGRRHPTADAVSAGYFVARWALSVALTWLAPFFAFYAVTGYIDNNDLLRGRRWPRLGAFAASLPVAAAQASGVPFDGAQWWAMFAGLLLANNVLLAVVTHLLLMEEERSTERAATIAELEATNAALQRALDENAALQAQLLLQAREAGVTDERTRLAAELHDTIAQGLTGIITQLQAVSTATDPATARRHVDRAAELARGSLGEARRSVRNLAPAGLAHDELPDVLRDTVARWAEHSGVRAEFTRTGAVGELHGELSATLLRITQEALANVARHAAADRVGVTLSYMDGEVTLDVRDDGRGFDARRPAPGGRHGGFGLAGMRARAERVAGSLTVESEPGHGTAVSARLPLVGPE
ncbi:sensor histidine kinase [Streptomyces sp. DSM 44915]|uniref:Sensor histidine kinase n=1 Tax=Streptomyces chisholmiae TaxID=3075540 RepID=A0ABU2JY19_9ACTN|nr:sensor histidine kinase [Streptomyces sp. DSM 44915]MDT0269896.1 sensor histidine kinase [Streptomyces sp. DSM 44915]